MKIILHSSIFFNNWDCSHEWTSKGGRWFCSDKGVFQSSWWSGLLHKGHKKKAKSLICQLTILPVDCVMYLIAGSVDFRDLDTQIKHRTCRLIPKLQLLPFSSCSTSLYPRPCQADSDGDYPVSSGREKRTCGKLSLHSLNSIALQGRSVMFVQG